MVVKLLLHTRARTILPTARRAAVGLSPCCGDGGVTTFMAYDVATDLALLLLILHMVVKNLCTCDHSQFFDRSSFDHRPTTLIDRLVGCWDSDATYYEVHDMVTNSWFTIVLSWLMNAPHAPHVGIQIEVVVGGMPCRFNQS